MFISSCSSAVTAAYLQDDDIKLILEHLRAKLKFSTATLKRLHTAYHDYILQDRISIVDHQLVVFQPVQNNSELLMLIVVPLSLRRDIFSAYHATPATGHMGLYKTLHHIRL